MLGSTSALFSWNRVLTFMFLITIVALSSFIEFGMSARADFIERNYRVNNLFNISYILFISLIILLVLLLAFIVFISLYV